MITWQTQLETQLKVCLAILNREVKTGLARLTGPDLGNLTETVEEECLIRQTEWGGVVCHLDILGLTII